MKNLPSVLAAAALLIVLLLYMCTYQVRFNEVAIVKTFGKADSETDVRREPGLYARWPWPFQSVDKFDTRIRILEDTVEETPTLDSKNVLVTTFTGWRIDNAYKFHVRYRRVADGEEALRNKVQTYKKAVVGKHVFSEFVSTDPAERKLDQIEQEMADAVASDALEQFGVRIEIFGIKRLGLPEAVTTAIFDSMKKLEENKAENYRTEGDAKAAEIVAEAEASRERIMAVAQRKADEIRNAGQRRVGEIYAAFTEHQDLRMFLDKLKALEEMLGTRSTLILDTEFVPVDLFKLDRPAAPQSSDPVDKATQSIQEAQPEPQLPTD